MPWPQPVSAASIWPVWFEVVVDRLLAHDDEPGLFGVDDAFEQLGDRERLGERVGLDQDAAIGAHGERGADGLARLRRADRDDDHLARLAGFLLPERLLDRDLVERIHRHLDVGELDSRAVGLETNLDVVVDHPFDGHENLHGPQNSCRTGRPRKQFEAETPNLGSSASQRG